MIFNREPVMFLGVLQAVLAMLVAFAFPLSGEQVGAIMAVAAAILSFVARSQVTPVASLPKPPADGAGA